jgi:hypothetical protein
MATRKLATSQSASQVAGPGLASVLVGALKAPFAIAVDAVSFAFSALSLAWVEHEETCAPVSGASRGANQNGRRGSLRRPSPIDAAGAHLGRDQQFLQ